MPVPARRTMRRMEKGHRPHRRHDDRARRQRVPDADRGTDPERTSGLAPIFVIELRREDRLDEMTVRVEARPGADDATRAACDRDLAYQVKALIGVTATVETLPGAVERSVGKAKADRGFKAGNSLYVCSISSPARRRASCTCAP